MAERIDCRTVDKPLPLNIRYFHPNARSIGTCQIGCCDYYECPDCGASFTIECPD